MRNSATARRVGFFSSLLLGSMLFLSPHYSNVNSQTSGQGCSGGFNLQLSTGSSTTISGPTNIILTAPTTSINKVLFKANDQVLGRAQINSANALSWSMPWITNLMAASSATTVQISAEVFATNATASCTVSGPQVFITNSTQATLSASVTPPSWEGPMSFGFPISVLPRVSNPDFNPTQYSLYTWSTTIGNLTFNNQLAQFFSGQTVGNGSISVKVIYGGKEVMTQVPITVKNADAPLPDPSTTTDTSTNMNTTTTESALSVREATLQNNPVAQECVVVALGEKRFEAINTGESRPTLAEVQKFNACFANSNYILPSNFAPVEPMTVKSLEKSTELTINNLKNEKKKKSDNEEIEVLVFSGRARPNSLVLIYVFSDPLVLTTTANDNGEWTYTLEDPIEPGNHEVYSVVDRGDGVYERSDPISFGIETAEAAEANPNGLSLRLSDEPTPAQSNRSLILYAASSVVVVGLAIVALVLISRHKANTNAQTALTMSQTPQATPAVIDPVTQSSEKP